jgi:hypothetical protein
VDPLLEGLGRLHRDEGRLEFRRGRGIDGPSCPAR